MEKNPQFKVGDLVRIGDTDLNKDRTYRVHEGNMGVVVEVTGTRPWMAFRVHVFDRGECSYFAEDLTLIS